MSCIADRQTIQLPNLDAGMRRGYLLPVNLLLKRAAAPHKYIFVGKSKNVHTGKLLIRGFKTNPWEPYILFIQSRCSMGSLGT